MEPWDNCNSLRYGFDENYDKPVFDDEDNSEEKETNEWSLLHFWLLCWLSLAAVS